MKRIGIGIAIGLVCAFVIASTAVVGQNNTAQEAKDRPRSSR